MDPLLYGHHADERIVAVQQKDDRTMRLYYRKGQTVESNDEQFYPFFFLSDSTLLEGFGRKHWAKRLDGTLFFQYLCVFEEWPVMWDAVRHVVDRSNRSALTKVEGYADLGVLHLLPDPVTQFLMQTGRTLFKGFSFKELHRLQLDIETYTPPAYRFSNASRKSDRIILIALSDSSGWTHVIDGKKHSEKQMLQELIRIILDRDPDVIEGHNIFNFDLPYLTTRCTIHGIPFGIGRDGSEPRTFETRTSFAEHAFEYNAAEIAGRHVIDTFLLVQSFDVSKRVLDGYSLKTAAQHFGLAVPDRTYIDPERISWHWDNDPKPLMAYALDDVTETNKLSAHLTPTAFYLAQMIPANFGSVARMGSAAKIEALMVREYLRQKHSLPRPQEGAQTTGGYTDVFLTGTLGPVVHADVESLYPSIMLTKGILPSTDTLKIFPELLRHLTAMRLEAKKGARDSVDPGEKSQLDAMQSSMKILINSFYGYLGYARALFNDYRKADEITGTGQQLLRQMIAYLQSTGSKVIEVDTDGIFFVPPPGINSQEDEEAYVARLSSQLPEGITVVMDGRSKRMLSYKKKNYALLGYDNRIRMKGSSLTSRSIERFGRTYIQQCVEHLLNNNIEGLHRLYVQYRQSILDHGLDARDFARVETLRDSLETYQEQVKAGKRNKSAAYEVALVQGRPYRPGDRIAYYITGSDPGVRSFENCKSIDEWDPNFPDENTSYYVRRLDEFSAKFAEFLHPPDFRAVFSADGLFPFDPKGVAPLITDVSERPPAEPEPPPSTRFGIWLDDQE